MARVRGSVATRSRRRKVLKLAKGYFGSKHTLYRTANQQVMKSLTYAYRDRKARKREFRKLWIQRINAAARLNGLSYSTLMHGLKLAKVDINRKMLSEIAIHNPEDFSKLCKSAEKALSK
jgi:large subunit ribosomal protein L20